MMSQDPMSLEPSENVKTLVVRGDGTGANIHTDV
jgi:hypothetical protein